MPDYARLIEECRTSFQSMLRHERRDHIPSVPQSRDSGIVQILIPHYEVLLLDGLIVWGALAQANSMLFATGTRDRPGVTVYSFDSHYDSNPLDLVDIARATGMLKGTHPYESDLLCLANRMTDEFDGTPRVSYPHRMTHGLSVYLAGTLFHPAQIPEGRIAGSLFPLLVSPTKTDANLLLPQAFWPRSLVEQWPQLAEGTTCGGIPSYAQSIVGSARKEVVSSADPIWDVAATPVHVMPEAVAAVRAIAAAHNIDSELYLCLSYVHSGEFAGDWKADLGVSYLPDSESCFPSGGIYVVVPTDDLERVRGHIVEYRSQLYGTGFVVRRRLG